MYIYTAHVLEESFSPDSFEIPPPSFASSLVGAFLLRRNIKTFCLSRKYDPFRHTRLATAGRKV